ncbi:MAG TPA: DUF1269 domain-containing protein [Solirubrobacteraceae bacterium]|jgi:uncharacterized membrane protein
MSFLVAVAYPQLRIAEQARRAMARLTVERVLEIEDAVIVVRDAPGGLRLHQAGPVDLEGAPAGAIWGGLIGMILLGPALGANGVDERFLRQLGAALDRGGAALLVLVRRCTPETLLPRLVDFDGEAFHTKLGADAEERLKTALGA